MTVLIVIAVILVLLYMPVTVELSFLNKKFEVRVKYLIFTFFSLPVKKKSKKEKKQKTLKKSKKNEDKPRGDLPDEKTEGKDSGEKTDDEDEDIDLEGDEKSQKEKLSERLGKLKRQSSMIWQLCEKHLKKIINNVSADRVNINFVAAAEDACSAALLYGKLSAAVWNTVAVTSAAKKVKYKSVSVTADFTSEEPVYDISARVKITPAVVAGNLIVAAFKLLVNLKKIRRAEKTA